MRTALHSWSFRKRFKDDPGFDIFQALDMTADMGFNAIEIMSGKADCPPGDFASDDPGYLNKVKKYAEDRDVDIVCLATYNDFAYVKDEAWRLANIEFIKKWLNIAAEMEVPNIRMLTGYYIEGEDRERLEALTRAGIAECVPVAEQCGVNMAIENHNSIFMSADEILALIDEFASPRLTTCPDPSNWGHKQFWSDDCPAEVRENVFSSAARLAPLATEAHLKIKGIDGDGNLMGFGEDLDRLLGSYRDAGYDGCVAFESIADDDLLAPLPRAREIVEAAIDRVVV